MHSIGKMVFVAVSFGAVCAAQSPEWLQVPTNASPAPMSHAMAYAGQGRVMAFGGYAYDLSQYPQSISVAYQTATWLWDGASWQVAASAVVPSPRTEHALSYDSARSCVVLFGGVDPSGVRLADTWEWTVAGWVLRSLVGPVPRHGHALAYDSGRQRTVLFGGFSAAGALSDTWEWNGLAWVPRFSATYPPPRSNHGLAYDPVRGRAVLVGGYGVGLGGTWEWDGSNWIDMGSPFGNDQEMHAVYDSLHGSVLAHGPSIGGAQASTRLWNGVSWIASPASLLPQRSRFAFDPQRLRTVAYGGVIPGYPFPWWPSATTYEYGYAPRPAVVTPYGAGCGAPPLGLAAAANSSPRIGETFRTDVADVPFGFPFVALGTNNQFVGPFPLPLVLDGFGFQGCLLHHNALVSQPCTLQSPPTLARHELPIPNIPALLTSRLYLQAWSLAPGVNAGGVVFSNGLEIVIGNS